MGRPWGGRGIASPLLGNQQPLDEPEINGCDLHGQDFVQLLASIGSQSADRLVFFRCQLEVSRGQIQKRRACFFDLDRKSTRLNSSHSRASRMPSSA